MSTWNKYNCVVQLTLTTLANDTTTHTVQFQPASQSFSNGAVLGTAGSGEPSRYRPVSDLDTEKAYDIYVDSTKVDRILGPDLIAEVGVSL